MSDCESEAGNKGSVAPNKDSFGSSHPHSLSYTSRRIGPSLGSSRKTLNASLHRAMADVIETNSVTWDLETFKKNDLNPSSQMETRNQDLSNGVHRPKIPHGRSHGIQDTERSGHDLGSRPIPVSNRSGALSACPSPTPFASASWGL